MLRKMALTSVFMLVFCVAHPRANAASSSQLSVRADSKPPAATILAQVEGQWGDDSGSEAVDQPAAGNGGSIPPTEMDPPGGDAEPPPGREMTINPPPGEAGDAGAGDGAAQQMVPVNPPVDPFQ